MTLLDLPNEMLLAIAERLASRQDLINFSSLNRNLYAATAAYKRDCLFSTIRVSSTHHETLLSHSHPLRWLFRFAKYPHLELPRYVKTINVLEDLPDLALASRSDFIPIDTNTEAWDRIVETVKAAQVYRNESEDLWTLALSLGNNVDALFLLMVVCPRLSCLRVGVDNAMEMRCSPSSLLFSRNFTFGMTELDAPIGIQQLEVSRGHLSLVFLGLPATPELRILQVELDSFHFTTSQDLLDLEAVRRAEGSNLEMITLSNVVSWEQLWSSIDGDTPPQIHNEMISQFLTTFKRLRQIELVQEVWTVRRDQINDTIRVRSPGGIQEFIYSLLSSNTPQLLTERGFRPYIQFERSSLVYPDDDADTERYSFRVRFTTSIDTKAPSSIANDQDPTGVWFALLPRMFH